MITTSYTPANYAGNGSLTSFAITFDFLLDSDNIKVSLKDTSTGIITDQVNPTHYTVSGSNVVFGTAPASGNTVIIELSENVGPDLTQEADYTEYDPFPAATHEAALDKLTIAAQLANELGSRALKLDPSVSSTVDGTISDIVNDGYLKFNAAGDGFESASLSDTAGLGNVSDDPSPTLGGNLDTDGHTIIGASSVEVVSPMLVVGNGATGPGKVRLKEDSDNGSNYIDVAAPSSVTGNRTVTMPDATTTLVGNDTTDTLTNKTLTSPAINSGVLTSCTGLTESGLSLTDITTNNASSSKHGFCPKLSGNAAQYMDGTGAFTAPASGSYTKIASSAASSSASISFTGLGTSTYRSYMVIFTGVVPATNSVDLYMTFSTNNGSSYLASTLYSYVKAGWASNGSTSAFAGSTGAGAIPLNHFSIYNGSTAGLCATIFFDSGNAENTKRVGMTGHSYYTDQTNSYYDVSLVGGNCNTSSATVNAVKFAMSSGNIASGTITIYGLAL